MKGKNVDQKDLLLTMWAKQQRKWERETDPMAWLTEIFLASEGKQNWFLGWVINVYIIKFSYPDYKYVLTG